MAITWVDNTTPLNAANMNLLEQLSNKNVANGYPALDSSANLALAAAQKIVWATDTNLYRAAADILKTDDSLYSAVDIVANAGAASQIWLHTNGHLYFGSAADTHVYRGAANFLRTDGGFSAGAPAGLNYVELSLDRIGGGQAQITFSNLLDTNLYRQGPGDLRTGGQFWANASSGTALSGFANAAGVPYLYLGSALDTYLYRVSAGILKTDANLQVVGYSATATELVARLGSATQINIGASGPSGQSGIAFQVGDTYLYRAAAAVLKTDGAYADGAMGTSFPASPVDGQIYVYAADATNGVYWQFRYVTSTGKWVFTGGPPLVSQILGNVNETTASATYAALTTPGPSITLPFTGDYDVTISHHCGVAQNEAARMSFDIGATAAIDDNSAGAASPATGGAINASASAERTTRIFAASGTLTAKYRTPNSQTSSFKNRVMMVIPVRK